MQGCELSSAISALSENSPEQSACSNTPMSTWLEWGSAVAVWPAPRPPPTRTPDRPYARTEISVQAGRRQGRISGIPLAEGCWPRRGVRESRAGASRCGRRGVEPEQACLIRACAKCLVQAPEGSRPEPESASAEGDSPVGSPRQVRGDAIAAAARVAEEERLLLGEEPPAHRVRAPLRPRGRDLSLASSRSPLAAGGEAPAQAAIRSPSSRRRSLPAHRFAGLPRAEESLAPCSAEPIAWTHRCVIATRVSPLGTWQTVGRRRRTRRRRPGAAARPRPGGRQC